MPTSIRLEPEIERRLDFLAASTGRSKAYYLRRIIERGIEDMEDYCNRSLSGVLCPPAPTRNNPSHVHQGGAGSDQGDSDQQQVAAA